MSNTKENTAKKKKDQTLRSWRGALSAYGVAYERIKHNPQPALLFIGAYVVLTVIGTLFDDEMAYMASGLSMLAHLVFLLALPVYGLALADNKRISLDEFMRFDTRRYLGVLVGSLLYLLIVAFSFLLLIIPIIWTIAWFYFVEYVVVDKKVDAVEALRRSKKMAFDHKAKVWGIIGVSILISIPASFLSLIPILGAAATAFVSVWVVAASAILYRWLQH